MIFTDRTITVRKGESRIDEPIVVYRGDYELEVRFTILNSKFRFMSGTNLIESEKASYGQLAILTPYGGNIFSDVVRCSDGSVTFVLTAEMLNQIEEVGLYSFQIRLMDYTKESRVSIPPIEYGIEVREPIASEDHDNSVNNAIVGYSIAKVVDPKEENVGDTFDANGQYNKTKWKTGDRISEGKLNKIEDAIDKINENEASNTALLSKRIDNNFNIIQAQLDEKPNKDQIGSPLTANGLDDMIDISRVYVNTTDGKWYSWDGYQWVAGGLYNSQGIANNSITKEYINGNVFEDDKLSIFNLKMNSTSRNRFTRMFFFSSNNNDTLKISGTIKTDMEKSNYIPLIAISFSKVFDTTNKGGEAINVTTINITESEQYFEFEVIDSGIYNYTRCDLVLFTNSYDDIDLIEIVNFKITSNGDIVSILNEGVDAGDLATYDYSLLMTGMDRFLSINDIEMLKDEIIKESDNILRVNDANELMDALKKASDNATSDNWYEIHIGKGVYDLLPFIDLDRITTVTANGYRGVEVPEFTKIIGDINRGSIIKVELPTNATTEQVWTVSPLNLRNSAHLYNLVVIGKNVRYACHDDGGNKSFDRYIENCEFIHEQNKVGVGLAQQDAYGMGCYKGSSVTFKDCDFKAYGYALYIHDNPNYNLSSNIRIENCRFESGEQRADHSIRFQGMGAKSLSTITMKNCSVNKSILLENTDVISMELKKYNTNIEE